jgi:hypothetical protein
MSANQPPDPSVVFGDPPSGMLSDASDCDRLSRISTLTNLVLDVSTPTAERTKLYFKYAIAFDVFLKNKLKQDPPPADISEEIWEKFMKMKFSHRGPGSFRRYLEVVLNSSIANYHAQRQKDAHGFPEDYDLADNRRIEAIKLESNPDAAASLPTGIEARDSDRPIPLQPRVIEDIDHYEARLRDFLTSSSIGNAEGIVASDGEIKSMVRGVLQTLSWDRFQQLESTSLSLDQEARQSGKKRGDSRWRYILAAKTCAQLRLDCDRSVVDVNRLVQVLTPLVQQKSLSAELAKQWASRGSRIYADVLVDCAAEMFGTVDWDIIEAELTELGLLKINFVKGALAKRKEESP